MNVNYAPLVVFIVIALFIVLSLASFLLSVDFGEYAGTVAFLIVYFIVFYFLIKYMCERGNQVGAWVLALFLPILFIILSVISSIQSISSAGQFFNEFAKIVSNEEVTNDEALEKAYIKVFGSNKTNKTLTGSTAESISGCPTEYFSSSEHCMTDYPEYGSISGSEINE